VIQIAKDKSMKITRKTPRKLRWRQVDGNFQDSRRARSLYPGDKDLDFQSVAKAIDIARAGHRQDRSDDAQD